MPENSVINLIIRTNFVFEDDELYMNTFNIANGDSLTEAVDVISHLLGRNCSVKRILNFPNQNIFNFQLNNKKKNSIRLRLEEIRQHLLQSNLTVASITFSQGQPGGGGSKEYVNLQSGGRRLVRYGKRGGRYYMKGGNKVYIK